MVAFENLGDEFIERVREGADFSGVEKPPQADCTDPYASGGDIPKDAGEKLGGKGSDKEREGHHSCDPPSAEEVGCVRRGSFCAYDCQSAQKFLLVPPVCDVIPSGEVECSKDFECEDFSCDGFDFNCVDGFECSGVYGTHDFTCGPVGQFECTPPAGAHFMCSQKTPAGGFTCTSFTCTGDDWFSCGPSPAGGDHACDAGSHTCSTTEGHKFYCDSAHFCAHIITCSVSFDCGDFTCNDEINCDLDEEFRCTSYDQ